MMETCDKLEALLQSLFGCDYINALEELPELTEEDLIFGDELDYDETNDFDATKLSEEPEKSENTEPQKPKLRTRLRRCSKPKRSNLEAAKIARNRGEAYRTFGGKQMPPRKQGPPCQSTCRLKCFERIEPQERKKIFDEFWNEANHTAQWHFIARNIVVLPKVKCTTERGESRRSNTRSYFFEIGNDIEKVCRPMFLNTLGISNQWVATVCKKIEKHGYVDNDSRGKNKKPFKHKLK